LCIRKSPMTTVYFRYGKAKWWPKWNALNSACSIRDSFY
uniref:Uncharacterized protein n=1 Tax=Echinostoma caproni TaxID=27848 RepID=A0A183B106_9TREM